MASNRRASAGMTEFCPSCGRERVHDVDIELRMENEQAENAAYSREPYRVRTCRSCGDTSARRMNNA